MLLTVCLVLFLCLYGLLLFFYLVQWKKLKTFQPAGQKPTVFVSVVVAARNEEHTLPLLLQDLKRQTYPPHLFEVVVVDDYSTDNTVGAVAPFTGSQVRLVAPNVPATFSSKKAAIASGIQAAKGSLILVTDADCRVAPSWVETVAAFQQESGAAFIAAPVKFAHNGSLLHIFQVLDFITLQGITAASVASNSHAMCNGANLAYTKAAFDAVNGFSGIDKVATGDDMLLMHKIWKAFPGAVFYLKSTDALVQTAPMKSWQQLYNQRRRWASKTLVYDDYRIILVLAFILLLNGLFFVLLVAAFFDKIYWLHLAAYLLGKTLFEAPFVASVARFYGEGKLMRYFFFLQPLHVLYTVFVGLASQAGTYEWKGRRTR